MASTLADSAQSLGLDIEDTQAHPTLPKPPELSPTARRLSRADQQAQVNYSYFNPVAELEREERIRQDLIADEAWKREMERMQLSADWKVKVAAQEQGYKALAALKDLRGDEPDYETRLVELSIRYPLALQDPTVRAALETREKVLESVKEARKLERDLDAQKELAEERRVQGLRDQYGAEVAKLSPRALEVYNKALKNNEAPSVAYQKAQQEDQTFRLEQALTVADVPDPAEAAKDPIKAAKLLDEAEKSRVKMAEYNNATRERNAVTNRIASLNRDIKKERDPARRAAIQDLIKDEEKRLRQLDELIRAYATERGLPGSDSETPEAQPSIKPVSSYYEGLGTATTAL